MNSMLLMVLFGFNEDFDYKQLTVAASNCEFIVSMIIQSPSTAKPVITVVQDSLPRNKAHHLSA